ncbi:MAG TPA: SAM-dependent methyltransferase, partial [Pilimelia sp.]|nr:SAM-dependent methyltransferase [Pilimelia sp.]
AADGPVPAPAEDEGPALVTMFRLVLNVPEAVRDRAVAFAAAALPHPHAGLLVLENHGNRGSLRHLRHRRRGGDEWFAELSHADVAALLARHGFTVDRRRGFTLFPQGWYGRAWLRPVIRPLDALLHRLRVLDRFAVDVLYVARRAS